MTTRFRAVPGITAIALAAGAWAAEVTLTPAFDKTERVYVEVVAETEQNIVGAMAPDGMTITSKEIHGFFEDADKQADKDKLRWVFDRCAMEFNHPMFGNMAYDSDSGKEATDDNSMSLMAAPWVGRKLVLTVSGEGEVTEMSGHDELLEAIDASALGDPLYEQSASRFNESSTRNSLFGVRFDPLPYKAVSEGDTWTRKRTSENPFLGETATEYECKLARIEEQNGRKVAAIEYTGRTTLAPGAEPPNRSGLVPDLRGQKSTGTLYVDVETGMPVRLEEKDEAEIALNMPQQADAGQADDAQDDEPAIVVTAVTKRTIRTLTEAERKADRKANREAAAKAAAEADDKAPE